MDNERTTGVMLARGLYSVCLVAALELLLGPACSGLLSDRVAKAAEERIAAGVYQTLVIGVIDRDKTEIVSLGKLESGKAPDGDTVYEIGSITKTFTATLLAQEVLNGHVTLDTPVAKLLPDFAIPERGGRPITLGTLATQCSGLPPFPLNLPPKDQRNPTGDYDAVKLRAFLSDYKLPRNPGESYEYSKVGFGLLGYALSRSQNKTYGELVEEKVLRPLGMKLSGSGVNAGMRPHVSIGHNERGQPVKYWTFDALAGAGSIDSTANDMMAYLKANMGATPAPLASAMAFAHAPRKDIDPNSRIGLAWMTTNQGVVWHGGGTDGYRSFLGLTSDGHLGVVILANTDAKLEDLGFAALVSDVPLSSPRKPVAIAPKRLGQFEGSYTFSDNTVIRLFRDDDALYALRPDQGAYPLYYSGADTVFARADDVSFSFTRSSSGVITGLVMQQNGDRPAARTGEAWPRIRVATAAGALHDYVGLYRFEAGGLFAVTLNAGELEAEVGGQPSYRFFVASKDHFFAKMLDAHIDFERDDRGEVVAAVLHQCGTEMRAKRLLH